ncbi:redox-sensing transcriptional repressor Rex [Alistipes sp. OttesenSCG-928-L06]|nr:redox-sensing transcriptional repressor Rex [Alistipes sp. OttesenSCG-928-L06]
MNFVPNNIPERTIERLSEYRRTLLNELAKGVTHLYSHNLANIHGITAVQVRRDLMLIGFSSDTKRGYDARVLVDFIGNILDGSEVMNVAVIGIGHIGQAVTQHFTGKRSKLKITMAFDIDPEKVGQKIAGVPVYHTGEFVRRVQENNAKIALLTLPTSVAPSMVQPIIDAGIKGVLNFTSTPLNFPEGIYVEDYDIITLLEKVAYFVKECEALQK